MPVSCCITCSNDAQADRAAEVASSGRTCAQPRCGVFSCSSISLISLPISCALPRSFCSTCSASARRPRIISQRGLYGRKNTPIRNSAPGIAMMPEHPAPVAGVAEGGIGQEGDQDADGDHQLVQRDHRAADALRRDLGQVQRRGEAGDADGDAENQPADDQYLRRPGHAAQHRAGHEQHRAKDQRALAAELGRHPRRAQRADGGAGHHDRDDPLDHAVADLELLLDEFLRSGNHADIQPEHQAGERGEDAGEDGGGLGADDDRLCNSTHGCASWRKGWA